MHKKTKEAVEEVLKEDVRARDNNLWLIICVLRKLGFHIYIDYSELERMPSLETITREKREIQNSENKYNDFIPDSLITYEHPK